MSSLQYDFSQEKEFSYKDLSLEQIIEHLSRFTANIWQVHPFCEGNEYLRQKMAYFQNSYINS